MQKYIFNRYDIRGRVEQDLTLEKVELLAKSIVRFYKAKIPDLDKISVAMDGRVHSQKMYDIISKVIVEQGLKVYFFGICPTPAFVFSLYKLPIKAGIMITGSNHSVEYNGLKLYLNKKSVWGKDIQKIYKYYKDFKNNKFIEAKIDGGKIVPCPILDQYVESLWQDFSHLSQYDFSMIIDCAHGSAGPIIKRLIKKMGWKKVKTLYCDPNNSFPVHKPDPSNVKNMSELHAGLLKFDDDAFGIGFDGDASRMIALERSGKLILGDRLLSLFAQDILKSNPGAKVVYDSKSSTVVKDTVLKSNGVPVISAVGCPVIKDQMELVDAIVGGEAAGHYFFRDRHSGHDDGIYAMCRLLDLLVKSRTSIYELLDKLPQKYNSDEIRIPCDRKHEVVSKIEKFALAQNLWKMSENDGLKLETDRGWGLIRACQTEPMISFRCEAATKADLKKLQNEFKDLLKFQVDPEILKQFMK